MKTSRFRRALRFAPLLALALAPPLAALDTPAPGGVEREAVQSGVYRTPVGRAAAAAAQPQMPLTVLPTFQVIAPNHWLSDRQYYRLKAELAWNADQPASLIYYQFAHGPQIRTFEAPKLGEVGIPWSPMVTEEPVLSVNYPNYVSDRLQVRFPLVNVLW